MPTSALAKLETLSPQPRCCNRIRSILVHTSRYSFEGQARLACDIGVSRSTVCRIMSGRNNPSFRMVRSITEALERALNRPIDPREVFSPNGTYPTASCCALCGCAHGCMPEYVFDGHDRVKPQYREMKPGDWSVSAATEKESNDSIPTTVTI